MKNGTRWTEKKDDHGWTDYTRGNCRISVSPGGTISLFAPACSGAQYKDLGAAKRAAARWPNRGW